VSSKITVIGNVVNSPTRNRTQSGSVTNFRVASNDRRFDTVTQDWIDGHSFFVDVECWGELGGNVSHSISKGDPVVVVGAIRTHEWECEQGRRSRPQIKADAVAPNLARGVADFRRTPRASSPMSEETGSADAPASEPQRGQFGDLVEGRDYEPDLETLDSVTPADLSAEPAHV
jgi:single-stranded DNA-binding protein